jgi:hydroxyethylthiazole kinase
MKDGLDVYDIYSRIRKEKPVVHHITNWVTIYDCANVVKAIGGSPIMAHAVEEVEDIVSIASCLVLNIGTLTVDVVETMKIAAKMANLRKIPVVLDICGVGASRLRNRKAYEISEISYIDIIKGNASEVASFAGENVFTKGVDSTEVNLDLVEIASSLAKRKHNTVVITGKNDIVSDGNNTFIVKNGHQLLTHVVGTGCMATSVIGAFAAVEKNRSIASVAALACFGIASEIAAEEVYGPAEFKTRFFDALYNLDRNLINQKIKVETL